MTPRAVTSVVLVMFATSGCAITSKITVTNSAPKPIIIGGVEFPEAQGMQWKLTVKAVLDAPPEVVFADVIDPIPDGDRIPKKAIVTIDHSRSDAGPNQWGTGSTFRGEYNGKSGEFTVIHCQPPYLVAHRKLVKSKSRTSRGLNVFELHRSQDGGTMMTVHLFMSTHKKPWWPGLLKWASGQSLKRDMGDLVHKHGGYYKLIDE
jgi:hypothetical protein